MNKSLHVLIALAICASQLLAESKTEHDLRVQVAAQRDLIDKLTTAQKSCGVSQTKAGLRYDETIKKANDNAQVSAEILAMDADIKQLVINAQITIERRGRVAAERDQQFLLYERLNAGMACALVLIFFMLFLIYKRKGPS